MTPGWRPTRTRGPGPSCSSCSADRRALRAMTPQLRRRLLTGIAIAVCATGIVVPFFDGLENFSLDILTGLRWHLLGNEHDAAQSPAVVVALDEETYRAPPFEGTPNITWTRELGRVLSAVIDGGASVAGFDIVFPVSIEQSQVPFGEETLGARIRGFDRDWLRSLAAAAKQGKV